MDIRVDGITKKANNLIDISNGDYSAFMRYVVDDTLAIEDSIIIGEFNWKRIHRFLNSKTNIENLKLSVKYSIFKDNFIMGFRLSSFIQKQYAISKNLYTKERLTGSINMELVIFEKRFSIHRHIIENDIWFQGCNFNDLLIIENVQIDNIICFDFCEFRYQQSDFNSISGKGHLQIMNSKSINLSFCNVSTSKLSVITTHSSGLCNFYACFPSEINLNSSSFNYLHIKESNERVVNQDGILLNLQDIKVKNHFELSQNINELTIFNARFNTFNTFDWNMIYRAILKYKIKSQNDYSHIRYTELGSVTDIYDFKRNLGLVYYFFEQIPIIENYLKHRENKIRLFKYYENQFLILRNIFDMQKVISERDRALVLHSKYRYRTQNRLYLILGLIGDYGTNPLKIVLAFFISVFIFGLVYLLFFPECVISANGTNLQFLDYLYFSGITSLTIGYGDYYPVTGIAKLLTFIEGTIGVFLMSYLVVSFSRKMHN
ncbi:MAG: potassium channel family protein [Acholeplasma sp.]|nr:potassium channel family protein [Acholeplasma sp.]